MHDMNSSDESTVPPPGLDEHVATVTEPRPCVPDALLTRHTITPSDNNDTPSDDSTLPLRMPICGKERPPQGPATVVKSCSTKLLDAEAIPQHLRLFETSCVGRKPDEPHCQQYAIHSQFEHSNADVPGLFPSPATTVEKSAQSHPLRTLPPYSSFEAILSTSDTIPGSKESATPQKADKNAISTRRGDAEEPSSSKEDASISKTAHALTSLGCGNVETRNIEASRKRSQRKVVSNPEVRKKPSSRSKRKKKSTESVSRKTTCRRHNTVATNGEQDRSGKYLEDFLAIDNLPSMNSVLKSTEEIQVTNHAEENRAWPPKNVPSVQSGQAHLPPFKELLRPCRNLALGPLLSATNSKQASQSPALLSGNQRRRESGRGRKKPNHKQHLEEKEYAKYGPVRSVRSLDAENERLSLELIRLQAELLRRGWDPTEALSTNSYIVVPGDNSNLTPTTPEADVATSTLCHEAAMLCSSSNRQNYTVDFPRNIAVVAGIHPFLGCLKRATEFALDRLIAQQVFEPCSVTKVCDLFEAVHFRLLMDVWKSHDSSDNGPHNCLLDQITDNIISDVTSFYRDMISPNSRIDLRWSKLLSRYIMNSLCRILQSFGDFYHMKLVRSLRDVLGKISRSFSTVDGSVQSFCDGWISTAIEVSISIAVYSPKSVSLLPLSDVYTICARNRLFAIRVYPSLPKESDSHEC